MSICYNKIGFIGAGNMASAIIRGVVKSDIISSSNIYIFDPDKRKTDALKSEIDLSIANNNRELASRTEIIVLAVKPSVVPVVLEDIKDCLSSKHTLISIAAGLNTKTIEDLIDYRCPVIRSMPNTPALIGQGMTAVCRPDGIDQQVFDYVCSIFSSFGRVEETREQLMDAVTAISGSSPAYVFLLIEALADGGVLMGLPRKQSIRMAAQAVMGSAKMVLDTGKHPGELKDMVSSPGGTTIEALLSLEKNSFRGTIMEAVEVCGLKSKSMGSDKDK